ncbi:Uncharacterized protein FWK35_00038899, partial [Aphis craccivora]
RSTFKIPSNFQKHLEKQKHQGKTGIFTQNWFLIKSILVFGVTLKQM